MSCSSGKVTVDLSEAVFTAAPDGGFAVSPDFAFAASPDFVRAFPVHKDHTTSSG